MTEKTAEFFVTQGVLGVLCLILLASIAFLYRELSAERAARIGDSKATLERLLSLQEGLLKAVESLRDVAETLRDLQREIRK